MPLNLIKPSLLDMQIDLAPFKFSKSPLDLDLADQGRDGISEQPENRHINYGNSQVRSPGLSMKNSSYFNTPRKRDLRTQSSKLHLIDDTTLTSLPFAPPAASKRLKRTNLASSRFTKNQKIAVPENQLLLSLDLSKTTLEGQIFADSLDLHKQDTTVDDCTCNYADDTLDDTFEESQDPIVLVEDYMTEAQSKETMFRKKSLANIKKRLREESLKSSFAPHFTSSEPFKIEFGKNAARFPAPGNEELEAIFGKIPGSEKLKYCTLCDKPLYEISSVLSSSEEKDMSTTNNLTHLYQEFVCWDCIVTYENILSELHEAEIEYSEDGIFLQDENKRASYIFNGNTSPHPFTDSPKKVYASTHSQKRRKFSTDLISRLQHLSEISQPKDHSSQANAGWLEKLKSKLNNLLSNAFTPSENSK